MRKTFPFSHPSRERARVVESIKNDLRKYVNRERKKTLPPEFDTWDFNCRVGATPEAATAKSLKELGRAVDEVDQAGEPAVYVEILAVPGHRPPRTPATTPPL